MIINSIHIATLLALALSTGVHEPNDAAATLPTTFTVTTITGAPVMPAGVEFTSEEGRFSVTLPPGYDEPTESVTPMETAGGNVDLKMYTSSSGNTAAMVAFANMEGKVEMEGNEKAMLDGARDNVLRTMNGKLLKKESQIQIDGHPGRRILLSMKPGRGMKLYGRLEMYLVNPIMYQVMYISTKRAAIESRAINSFFTSFTVR